ncbi:hypothetical protein P4O66_008382 [Electrophorus voltai]|uniref:Uncharacterized protein n=1 Tax=Electrophorus voltai TaxID=2609070 RepID=A0AAD9DXU6_9TELE|nr:hypothetical protein P4O66_008382 [Electrophorus voltai]
MGFSSAFIPSSQNCSTINSPNSAHLLPCVNRPPASSQEESSRRGWENSLQILKQLVLLPTQGWVLSLVLYSQYTNYCPSMDPSVKILKSEVCNLLNYRRVVEQLVFWNSHNNLELNMLKTVEMIVNLRRKPPPPLTAPVIYVKNVMDMVSINLELNMLKTVEMIVNLRRKKPPPLTAPVICVKNVMDMVCIRFLGSTNTRELKSYININSFTKKDQHRMYFLHQLKKISCSLSSSLCL